MDITIIYSMPTKRARNTPYALTDEDTKHSVDVVSRALHRLHHNVHILPINENSIASIESIRADCVFNLIEWTGLDLPLAIRAIKILESLTIPFTGVNAKTYANTTNKIIMKQLFDTYELPTPLWQVFYTSNEPIRRDFHYPVIMKPAYEHCSIGVFSDAIVRNPLQVRTRLKEKIAQFHQPFIIEEYVNGDEYHVPIIEESGSIRILPPAQIRFDKTITHPILTFYGRWVPGHPEFSSASIGMARLTPLLAQTIAHTCVKAFSMFRMRGYGRIDLRMKGKIVYLLEINSNPGLDNDPEYEMMYSAKLAGMSFTKLISSIVQTATSG